MQRCCPLLLQPILKEKVWGGRRLERYGKPLPEGALIGESWELADLASTSASGGGGAEARSRIVGGPLAGRTLREAMEMWEMDLTGEAAPTPEGGFPLLVKYLDARENLSVQVHPSPEYAAANPDAHLKTESWYILEAEPGAVIYKGLREGVTAEQFRGCIEGGTVVEALKAVPAVPGECHTLPSGTCHALGAGVLVAEVQTPSDTTFRVYDWAKELGRAGRELHVNEALECMLFGPAPGAESRSEPGAARLSQTEFYTIDEFRLRGGDRAAAGQAGRCSVLMAVRGRGRVEASDGSFAQMPLRTGETVLVPAAVADSAEVHADGDLVLLRIEVR